MPGSSSTNLDTLVYNIAIHNCEASYKKLFDSLFNILFRFSLCMVHSKEAAEEVASDVMFNLWQKRMELLQVKNLRVYALAIARNLSFNYLKKNARTRMLSLDDISPETNQQSSSPEQILIEAQNKAKLEFCINALPTRCKLVFKLIKEEGLSYKEVADVLNISPKTVDAHLVTSMKKLSEALKVHFYRV